jgi:hypothetical protein
MSTGKSLLEGIGFGSLSVSVASFDVRAGKDGENILVLAVFLCSVMNKTFEIVMYGIRRRVLQSRPAVPSKPAV